MSIYIPGMELPKSCISCPFMISRDNDDCILQSEESNESFENWEQMKAGCPLVEVPPHGALKDIGAIPKSALRGEKDDLIDAIILAPTIIPADPEEEDGAALREVDHG